MLEKKKLKSRSHRVLKWDIEELKFLIIESQHFIFLHNWKWWSIIAHTKKNIFLPGFVFLFALKISRISKT